MVLSGTHGFKMEFSISLPISLLCPSKFEFMLWRGSAQGPHRPAPRLSKAAPRTLQQQLFRGYRHLFCWFQRGHWVTVALYVVSKRQAIVLPCRTERSPSVPFWDEPTFLSKSWSHMSLMVQPAPRIRTAPVPNRDNMYQSGRQPGSAARPMLQVHGRYSSQVPEQKERDIQGCRFKLANCFHLLECCIQKK